MKTLRCIVADDEPQALELIKKYVADTPFLSLVAACNNSNDVLETLEKSSVDLLFLDIQMPGLNGISLAKIIDPSLPIVFTTAFDQYALEGYKVNAVGYLLKPFGYDEFLTAANKILTQQNITETAAENTSEYIIVKADYKTWQIPLADILFFEGVKDYVRIHRKSVQKVLMPLLSLKTLEQQLPPQQFMRVHRSYIVNVNQIEVIERNQIIFGENRITVSENYRENFNMFIQQRLGK